MNIVIAGAGQVGTHLAKMLSTERHDIVLLDQKEEHLKPLDANFDLMTHAGSPVSIYDLKDSNIKNADLFIAVTPYESENITSCILAKDLGAKMTVARIDNNDYVQPENIERFKRFGVDSLIYPEMLAAREIVQSLRMPGIRQLFDFSDGELILIGLKIRGNAPIVNKPLAYLDARDENYRILAITRGYDTIIPTGDDEIEDGDIVYFITTKAQLPVVKERAGKKNFDVRNVMIMGGSRIGIKTAQFVPDYYNVKIVEIDKARSFKIVDKLDRALVINGDGRDMDLLREEGIDKMDAFVALTGNAETNILSCMLAKQMGVKKTVAEVENIDYFGLAENFGVGTIINKKRIAASHIYQLTLNAEVSHVKCLTASDAEVMELVATDGSKITRGKLNEMKLPRDVNIGAVIRNGEIFIAHGDLQILTGDQVIVFCLPSGIRKIEKLF
ncbi:Trk system potassium transporter TrkA [Saccharicrinis sp. FJH2]|uniref:Trk system potassium transporter TrkA n=1 Tax=unclassified Saccharicrinis TaxID=2646859 RepID=UPI0035D40E04